MNDETDYLHLNRPIESLTVSELSRMIKTALALKEQTVGRGEGLDEVLRDLIERLREDRQYLERLISKREKPKY